jgi:hypothetical protein
MAARFYSSKCGERPNCTRPDPVPLTVTTAPECVSPLTFRDSSLMCEFLPVSPGRERLFHLMLTRVTPFKGWLD